MSSEGYDVLRLIEHNRSCYVSSEYIRGRILIHWLKYHPHMSKEQLFTWMYEIMRQLGLFHRLRGKPCYQYVNPYSIVVNSEEGLYLLDVGTGSNEILTKKMQRRAVRENFLPPEETVYRKASAGLDIYGLGRTWQYMLSAAEPEPGLTKKEEKKFQKIISRCLNRQSKKAYQSIEEIQKHFPASKSKKMYLQKLRKPLCLAAVLLLSAAGIKILISGGGSGEPPVPKPLKESKEAADNVVKKGEKDDVSNLLKFEMGMVYLLELGEYGKAAEYLEEITQYGAECYAIVARCLEKEGYNTQEQALAEALERAEEEIPKGMEKICIHGLIKGYTLLDTEETAACIVRLGEVYQNLAEDGSRDEMAEKEIMESMAVSYEQLERREDAASMYEAVLEKEEVESKRGELYKKLTLLCEESGRKEKAWEICRKGIDELQDSAELRLIYIRMQCKDTSLDRAVCAETIKEYMAQMPELAEQEEFKKLQREYDIRVEGEEVWVGK